MTVAYSRAGDSLQTEDHTLVDEAARYLLTWRDEYPLYFHDPAAVGVIVGDGMMGIADAPVNPRGPGEVVCRGCRLIKAKHLMRGLRCVDCL